MVRNPNVMRFRKPEPISVNSTPAQSRILEAGNLLQVDRVERTTQSIEVSSERCLPPPLTPSGRTLWSSDRGSPSHRASCTSSGTPIILSNEISTSPPNTPHTHTLVWNGTTTVLLQQSTALTAAGHRLLQLLSNKRLLCRLLALVDGVPLLRAKGALMFFPTSLMEYRREMSETDRLRGGLGFFWTTDVESMGRRALQTRATGVESPETPAANSDTVTAV